MRLEDRAKEAVKTAIESPLLETTIDGAKAILLYVSGGYDLGMLEVQEVASLVEEKADKDCILIFGAAVNEEMKDEIAITVIATGFGGGLDEGIEGLGFNRARTNPEPEEVVTEDGLTGRTVTLSDIFGEAGDEEEGDSRFGIPQFLNK